MSISSVGNMPVSPRIIGSANTMYLITVVTVSNSLTTFIKLCTSFLQAAGANLRNTFKRSTSVSSIYVMGFRGARGSF